MTTAKKKKPKPRCGCPEGTEHRFVAYITTRDGKRIWAKWFGYRGFPLCPSAPPANDDEEK